MSRFCGGSAARPCVCSCDRGGCAPAAAACSESGLYSAAGLRFGRLPAPELCLRPADTPLSPDEKAEVRPWGCPSCPEDGCKPIDCPDSPEDAREPKGCLGCPDVGREPVGCPEDDCKRSLLFPEPVLPDMLWSDLCFLTGSPSSWSSPLSVSLGNVCAHRSMSSCELHSPGTPVLTNTID